MTTRLVRIEVSGTTVTVDAEEAGQARRLGVWPDGIASLQRLFTLIGEPHEMLQLEGKHVMIWRIDAKTLPKHEMAIGSGAWPPQGEKD